MIVPFAILFSVAPAPEIQAPRALRPDLAVDLIASEPEIATPVALAVDSRGRVWVIESNTHFQKAGYTRHPTDRILVLEDEGGDPRADRITVFADGFHQSMGLEPDGEGRVLLATRREVVRLEDHDGDGKSDRTRSLARLETLENYPHNGLSGFATDDLGNIFFAIGENMGVPYTLLGSDGAAVRGGPEGGSIFRMRPDGSGLTRWATGYWNTFHMAFDAFGRLFAVDNDPDSRPPCRLLHIVRGGDHGYRRWLGRKGLHPFTAWNGELPGTLPMVCGTGEAPSGIVACEREGLPGDLHGSFIITSWGDYRIEAHRLEERGASFRSRPEVLVQGDERFRPVGIAMAPDGAVYFSDWVHRDYPVHGSGRIWRLRARSPVEPRKALPPAADPRARYRALVARARRGELPGGAGVPGLGDDSPEVRAAAVRLLGETKGLPAELFLEVLEDPAPPVRLEAVLSFREPAGSQKAREGVQPALERLLLETDPYLFATAVEALARLCGPEALLPRAADPDPRVRLGILLSLRRTGSPSARAALEGFLADPDLEVRRAAFQWVGEERLTAERERLEASFRSAPLSGKLFDAYLAAVGLLEGEEPDGRDAIGRDEVLLRLACDRSREPAFRAVALRSLSPSHPALLAGALRGLLADPDPGVRLEAVRTLRESAHHDAPSILRALAIDSREPVALRREALLSLTRFAPESYGDLRAALKDPEPVIASEARRALRLAGEAGSAPTAGTVPPGWSPGEEGQSEALSGGDPAEGEIIFFYPRGPRCSSCHSVRGRGGIAGPDLTAAGRTPRPKLLDSILHPEKEIAPQYTTWIITTAEGPRVGTLLGEEPDGSIILGNGEGRLERIPRESIRSRSNVASSLMPENLVALLTAREVRDLLAFLEAQR